MSALYKLIKFKFSKRAQKQGGRNVVIAPFNQIKQFQLMATVINYHDPPAIASKTQLDLLLSQVAKLGKKQLDLEEAKRKIEISREELKDEDYHYTHNRDTSQNNISIEILERTLDYLQIIRQKDTQSTKRIQSKRLWLEKKRKLLFKVMEKDLRLAKTNDSPGIYNVFQDANLKSGCVGQAVNAKQIQSCLQGYARKIFKGSKNEQLLNFLSEKHKVYLPRTVMQGINIHGYKKQDFQRIRKYKLRKDLPLMNHKFDKIRKICSDPNFTPTDIQQKETEPEKQIKSYDEYPQIQKTGVQLPEDGVFRSAWRKMAKNIFKMTKSFQKQKQQNNLIQKRLAVTMVRQVSTIYEKSIRLQKDYTVRARRLYKETAIYWRRKEKQLIEVKKKKEKLEAEMKKKDEQEKQKVLQSKRLQFLMKQSELYAHFMAKKLGTQTNDPMIKDANKPQVEIDEEAMKLNFSEMIQEQQQKVKSRGDKFDLSAVDQQTQSSLITTPSSFKGDLKQYQLKGLRWLDHLHEQAINGILADEMGLGKTIQAISLLSHISENKNIYGPFLVVAPSSTLFNWQQELQKFSPSLKVLPYWGSLKQRKMIRKFFNSKKFTGQPDSPFHVVITSYPLVVSDQKSFHRLKWEYIILDEAQAIKNVSSQRWTTLMSFQAHNKLLLTGTPIQNTMAELWALLHFIMPNLFDSHEQFQEWFSKDIQAHSQDQKALNQHQIQRLHGILKPFMLRRVKKDVEHEIGKKVEEQIVCEMTKRQQQLYDSIKQKLNLKDYFKMADSKLKVQNLMNLVMQLRKVCNHPELFERRPSKSPYLFQIMNNYTGHQQARNKLGEAKLVAFIAVNPISFELPKLVYDTLFEDQFQRDSFIQKKFNVFTPQNILSSEAFGWVNCMGMKANHVSDSFKQHPLALKLMLIHWMKRSSGYISTLSTKQSVYLDQPQIDQMFQVKQPTYKPFQIYIPTVTAPRINIQISSISYYERQSLFYKNSFLRQIEFGSPQTEQPSLNIFEPVKVPIEVVNFDSLVADSTKLRQLSILLKQKHENGDRVLIFSQMTKMLDILEDFMVKKRYSYFRLDGSLNIADRRDMVNEFQTNDKIFAFLLSTRAGGLGITLTAANTVIFYDNDWNPTMDAQATDRAHRIGQARDVYVYRMVTKGTIEQRIVKRAQQKQTVQSTVYDGATAKSDVFKPHDIIKLVLDDNEMQNQDAQELINKLGKVKEKGKKMVEE